MMVMPGTRRTTSEAFRSGLFDIWAAETPLVTCGTAFIVPSMAISVSLRIRAFTTTSSTSSESLSRQTSTPSTSAATLHDTSMLL